MDGQRFDALLRRAAQQTTRREAIGALIAGVLLLGNQGASEGTRQAEKRKKRKKRERKHS